MGATTRRVDDVDAHLGNTGTYEKVRRFRALYALQLQQLFPGGLGRVGTPTFLPLRYPVGLRICYKDADGNAALLIEVGAADDQAICLSGRDAKNNLFERIILVPDLRTRLHGLLTSLSPDKFFDKTRAQIVDTRDNLEFYRALARGLDFSRGHDKRSLAGTQFDIIQVLCKTQLLVGGSMSQSLAPVTIELLGEEPSS